MLCLVFMRPFVRREMNRVQPADIEAQVLADLGTLTKGVCLSVFIVDKLYKPFEYNIFVFTQNKTKQKHRQKNGDRYSNRKINLVVAELRQITYKKIKKIPDFDADQLCNVLR